MKKLWLIGAGVVTLCAAGCGGSDCERAEDASKELETKVEQCKSPGDYEGVTASTCEEAVGRCSESELDAMQEYFDCVEELPRCTSATRDDFREKLNDCIQPLVEMDMREDCAAAFLPSDLEV